MLQHAAMAEQLTLQRHRAALSAAASHRVGLAATVSAPRGPGRMKSRFSGVSWNKTAQRWHVQIQVDGKQPTPLGQFECEIDAAKAWDAYAIAHELPRRLNFPNAVGARQHLVVKRRSRFTGVSWYKAGAKWEAYIRFQGKQKSLGYFFDENEAARAYDKFAIDNNVNRPLNFPNDPASASHNYVPKRRASSSAASSAARKKRQKLKATVKASPRRPSVAGGAAAASASFELRPLSPSVANTAAPPAPAPSQAAIVATSAGAAAVEGGGGGAAAYASSRRAK